MVVDDFPAVRDVSAIEDCYDTEVSETSDGPLLGG
jgi:hypothetical protein